MGFAIFWHRAVSNCRGGLSSGVHAGSSGNFGLVIGVARKGDAVELKQHGANVVVNDLGELVD